MKINDLVEEYGELEIPNYQLKQLGVTIPVNRFEKPKFGERYYYIDHLYRVNSTAFGLVKDDDRINFETGNCYPFKYWTTLEIEQIANKKKEYSVALCRLKKEIVKLNKGWLPNWNDRKQRKYDIRFNHHYREPMITAGFDITWQIHDNWFYLKSKDIAKKIIMTHSRELEIYLGIKKDFAHSD